jgi:AcrR family transcriptional regulator
MRAPILKPRKPASPEVVSEKSASQRIVAEARHHFLTHGFRRVTMDDLAEELGMSKKTLYASFPSKSALLEAVLLDKIRSIEADFEKVGTGSPDDFLGTLHRLLACVQLHTDEIRPPFVRDLRREGPEMFKLIESRRRALIERHFGKLLDQGRKAGIIRRDISTQVMIEILLGATEAVMNPQKLTELDLTPGAGYSAIVSVVFHGVLAAKGRSKR